MCSPDVQAAVGNRSAVGARPAPAEMSAKHREMLQAGSPELKIQALVEGGLARGGHSWPALFVGSVRGMVDGA